MEEIIKSTTLLSDQEKNDLLQKLPTLSEDRKQKLTQLFQIHELTEKLSQTSQNKNLNYASEKLDQINFRLNDTFRGSVGELSQQQQQKDSDKAEEILKSLG